MEFRFTFLGPPVGFKRVRTNKGRFFNDPVYSAYKKAIGAIILSALDSLPDIPMPGTKERSKYLKENRFSLSGNFFLDKDRGDIDNYIKTFSDIFQDIGLIGDDVQIDEIQAKKTLDRKNPRVEIELTKISK